MNSHLLHGKVRHQRSRVTNYALEHDVYYFALDLDELDQTTSRLPLIARNRRALVTFRDDDHLPERATDLPSDLRRHLRREGIEIGHGRITLVTNLRVLGYVFNPASFYLCRDTAGALVAVVVEVHNTYGERHLYTLRPEVPGRGFSAQMDKAFHVSPFIGPDGRYRVTVREEADRLSIGIGLRDGQGTLLATSLVLRRRPLTTLGLLRTLLRHPLMTQRTIVLIHWHALRLWLRRVPLLRYVPPARAKDDRPAGAAHGAGR
jgi:DUF1365 family protein